MLRAAFDLSEREILRNRLLVSEQVLVGVHRTSAREEEARQLARERTRDLEFEWATFLTRGMEQGAIPEADPRLLARASSGSTTASSTGTARAAGLALARRRRLLRPALPGGRGPAADERRRGGAGAQARQGEALTRHTATGSR